MPFSPALAALLTLASPADRIAADGQVAAPEGFRVRLPAGFRYQSKEDDGRVVYAAASRDGASLVAVSALRSERGLDCDPDTLDDAGDDDAEGSEEDGAGEQEDDEGEGEDAPLRMTPFRTARGLDGCTLTANAERGETTSSFVGSGDLVVVVNALALHRGDARRLASAVADSVVVGGPRTRAPRPLELPTADPRIVGCFERSSSIPSTVAVRCYRADFTVTQQVNTATTFTSAIEPGRRDGSASAQDGAGGWWWYEDGTLTVELGGGPAEAPVELHADEMVLGEQLWTRLGE